MARTEQLRDSASLTPVIAALRQLGGWQPTAAVRDACGFTHDTTLQMLHEAVGTGQAEVRTTIASPTYYEWHAKGEAWATRQPPRRAKSEDQDSTTRQAKERNHVMPTYATATPAEGARTHIVSPLHEGETLCGRTIHELQGHEVGLLCQSCHRLYSFCEEMERQQTTIKKLADSLEWALANLRRFPRSTFAFNRHLFETACAALKAAKP